MCVLDKKNMMRYFALAVIAMGLLLRPGRAFVDDAYSLALEQVVDLLEEEDFTLREDYVRGEVSGTSLEKLIRSQLFRGHEYRIVVSTSDPHIAQKVTLNLYDADGELSEVESFSNSHWASVSVRPEKTGTYFLLLKIELPEKEAQDLQWAVVYTYR